MDPTQPAQANNQPNITPNSTQPESQPTQKSSSNIILLTLIVILTIMAVIIGGYILFSINQKKTLPCSAYLEGEYGVSDIYCGVPVILGKNGIEKIVEIKLTESEKKRFDSAVTNIKSMIAHLK